MEHRFQYVSSTLAVLERNKGLIPAMGQPWVDLLCGRDKDRISLACLSDIEQMGLSFCRACLGGGWHMPHTDL